MRCLPTTVSMFPFCRLRQRLSCQDNHKTTSASSSRQRLSCRDQTWDCQPLLFKAKVESPGQTWDCQRLLFETSTELSGQAWNYQVLLFKANNESPEHAVYSQHLLWGQVWARQSVSPLRPRLCCQNKLETASTSSSETSKCCVVWVCVPQLQVVVPSM